MLFSWATRVYHNLKRRPLGSVGPESTQIVETETTSEVIQVSCTIVELSTFSVQVVNDAGT
jgi:hypothetical protein